MSQYFTKPFRSFGENINLKFGFSTKTDLKNVTYIDTSSFALKKSLANLKTEVDKLDIDRLIPVPVDLNKLSNVVINEVVKKTMYDKVVAKVNIENSRFVFTTKYDAEKTKSLILVSLLKNYILMLKLVKQKVKYQVLVI